MPDFYINPLSANEQCFDIQGISNAISGLVGCFQYLRPALDVGRLKIIYDPRIELRRLIVAQHFLASLNDMVMAESDPDNRRLWFLYIKNHVEILDWDSSLNVSVSSGDSTGGVMSGEIHGVSLHNATIWLSIGGAPLHQSADFIVEGQDIIPHKVRNAYNVRSLRARLPRYERSDKHRVVAYISASGDSVSPMPLSDGEAERLLLCSVADGNDRWAVYRQDDTYYRFKPTSPDLSVYHGFQVDRSEVPANVQREFEANW